MPDFLRRVMSRNHISMRDLGAATRSLAMLDEQTSNKRTELEGLERELLARRQLLNGEPNPVLVEVNQNLVLAALRAESVAETAMSTLGELNRTIRRDPLTGTPNRVTLMDRLESAIALSRRHGNRLAVLFLDLDQFKAINDTLGHAVGDAVLQLAARRLESAVRDSDTVSRYGGDEFVLLLTEVLHPADTARVAAKIIAALSAPGRVGEHVLRLSASLGIAIYPDDGKDAATLINLADRAMYRCKKQKPGTFGFQGDTPASEHEKTSVTPFEFPRPWAETRLQDLRDVNERLMIAALAAQEVSIRNAEEAHRRQIKFLAMVAHELRNPLTPIRTAADLLEHAGADKPLLTRLQTIIKGQVCHLSRIVEDLLDGSRISTGKLRLETTLVQLTHVLSLATQTSRAAMEARHQTLQIHLPELSPCVLGDSVRLVQVFVNLLDNASKYTQNGGAIRLEMRFLEHSAQITVSDDGIGITPEALPTIFGLFVQDERAMAIDQHGLGIGLAVVRALVEAHGGTVTGKSAGKNLGSQFTVVLPLFCPPEGSPAAS